MEGRVRHLRGPPRPPAALLGLPVLVLDHSVHDLLHLLGEVGRVWGELLSGWPPTLLLLLALVILVTAAGAGGRGGGAGVAVPLALPRRFLLPDLLFDLLQRALLDGLQGQ